MTTSSTRRAARDLAARRSVRELHGTPTPIVPSAVDTVPPSRPAASRSPRTGPSGRDAAPRQRAGRPGTASALDSRELIGQATGILEERFTVDDGAFRRLVTTSQDTDGRLVDVAQRGGTEP